MATGSSRPRPPRPLPPARRTTNRASARAPRPEPITPADLGLGHLFSISREAVVVGNAETGRIALWNPAAEQLFGYTANEARGQLIEILMPPPIAQLHREGLAQYRRTGQARLLVSAAPIEVPALKKDGTEIRVELSFARSRGFDMRTTMTQRATQQLRRPS